MWVEGTAPGVFTDYDESTLPYQVIRRRDDITGTVTGKPFEVYFDCNELDFVNRAVGDDDNNPYPSFVTPSDQEGIADRFVTGLGFFQDRLVVASGTSVTMSEAGNWGSFFRTTQLAVPDSDRIDVFLTGADSSQIVDITTSGNNLFLRGARGINILETGDQPLTPRSVGFRLVYAGGSGKLAQMAPVHGGVVFSEERSDADALTWLVPTSGGFEPVDLTVGTSGYLGAPINTIKWSPDGKFLFVHSRENLADKIRVCRLPLGRKEVSWASLGGLDTIQSMTIAGDELYTLQNRPDSSTLESIVLDPFPVDGSQTWSVHLDRRVVETDVDMVFASGSTTITLPYKLDTTRDVRVVHRDSALFGVQYAVTSVSNVSDLGTVVVTGDLTADEFFVGQTFQAECSLMSPVPRVRNQDGSFRALGVSKILVRSMSVGYTDTGELNVRVTNPYTGVSTPSGDGAAPLVDGETASGVTLESAVEHVAVGQSHDDMDVKISSTDHKPTIISAVEWGVELVDTGARVTS